MRARMRWLFRRRLCFGGLAGALVFFCIAMTPSLLPRGDVLQGVLSGITVAIGYGLGSALSAGIRKVRKGEPSRSFKRISWWVLLGATVVLVPLFLVLGGNWQNDVRDLMGMTQTNGWDWLAILALTVVFGLLLLLISRLVRGLGRVLVRVVDRFAPRVVSVSVGVGLTVLVVVGLIQGFLLDPALAALSSAYSVVNGGTEPGIDRKSVV